MLTVRQGRSGSSGVSIVELMVAVAIVGILAMLGLPAFTSWIQDAQIRTAAEGVVSGMQLARLEAVRRNQDIEFVLTSPGTKGGTGWTVRPIDGAQIQSRPNGEGSRNVTFTVEPPVEPPAEMRLTFNGFGRISNTNHDGSDVLVRVDVDNGSGHALRITTADGQPRMCDPGVAETEDPRKC